MKKLIIVVFFFLSCGSFAGTQEHLEGTCAEGHERLIRQLFEMAQKENADMEICVFESTGIEQRIPEGCSIGGMIVVFGKDSDNSTLSVAVQNPNGNIFVLRAQGEGNWPQLEAEIFGLGIKNTKGAIALKDTVSFFETILASVPVSEHSLLTVRSETEE